MIEGLGVDYICPKYRLNSANRVLYNMSKASTVVYFGQIGQRTNIMWPTLNELLIWAETVVTSCLVSIVTKDDLG